MLSSATSPAVFSMPSIRTLRTFLVVARQGSFAAAGKQVGLTAAAVGLQIRALEGELGRTLFDRSGRSIVLNPAGRGLVDPVAELVGRYDALARPRARDQLSGTIVMGALVSALMGAFADALWALKRRHPALEVSLFAGQSSDFALRVGRGELDAAIVMEPPMRLASNLVWTPLYAEPMVLIVPSRPRFELAVDARSILETNPFMRFDHSTWTGDLVNRVLAQCSSVVNEGLELNSVEAIVALVRQGFGVAIVPRLANVQWSRDRALRIVPLPGEPVLRNVGLLERREHARKRFTAAIKDYFAKRDASRKRAKPPARSAARRPATGIAPVDNGADGPARNPRRRTS